MSTKKSKGKKKKTSDEDLKSKLKKVVIEKPKNSDKEKSGDMKKSSEESLGSEEFNGINFTEDLRRVLSFKPPSQEVVYLGENLENSVRFAPRISGRDNKKGISYSETKYDANMYNENKYDEKTPDYSSGMGTGEKSPTEGSSKNVSSQ